jgi:enoyl-CoA hydratase/carnithine racemase
MVGPQAAGLAWAEETRSFPVTTRQIGDVKVHVRGNVVEATLDSVSTRNALSTKVIDGLHGAIDVAGKSHASVLLVRGAGGNFCSGADMRETSALVKRGHHEVERFVARIADVLGRLETLPLATVAVVEGYALAGGFELLLACDIAIGSSTALLGDRHMEHAVLPGAGSSARLLDALTRSRARYLLLSGDMITAEQAAEWGLLTFVSSPENLDRDVGRLVERLSTVSPAALASMKRIILANSCRDIPQAVANERRISREYAANSTDRAEGIAAFLNRKTE